MVVVALIVCAFLPTQTLLDEDEAAYSYLFTAEQRAEFDYLTTQQQRERYIDRFWRGLDPTSETDYNELREMFLRRVEFANLYYDVDIAKGWRTDRGKVLIFYGFPTMIRRSSFGPSDDIKREIWTYGVAHGPYSVQLVFVDQYDTGEFVLETDVAFPATLSLSPELPRLAGEEGEPGGGR